MKKISLQYQITLRIFMEAYEHHWKSQNLGTASSIFIYIAGITLGICIAFYQLIFGIVLISASCILMSIIFLRKFLLKRNFKNSPKYLKETKVTFSDLTIQTENAVGNSELNWNIYNAYTETTSYFLLYMSKHSFSIIPKFAFQNNDELEGFRNLIKDKIR